MCNKNTEEEIRSIFRLLNEWYYFPNYQLERRVDIFFAHFLLEILSIDEPKDSVHIIPEFPLWAELKPDGKATRHSKKVDYAVISKHTTTVYFVELKTTDKSIKDSVKKDEKLQVERMAELYRKDWYDLLADALFICNRYDEYKELREFLCGSMNIDVYKIKPLYKEPDINKWRSEIKKLSLLDTSKKWNIKPIYIIPMKCTKEDSKNETPNYETYLKNYDIDEDIDFTVITFNDVINVLNTKNNPLANEFSIFLSNILKKTKVYPSNTQTVEAQCNNDL